jgi:hypothetical protein
LRKIAGQHRGGALVGGVLGAIIGADWPVAMHGRRHALQARPSAPWAARPWPAAAAAKPAPVARRALSRGGAPSAYAQSDYYYAAPSWYRPWVYVDNAWIYRPYPYHGWYYRTYRPMPRGGYYGGPGRGWGGPRSGYYGRGGWGGGWGHGHHH